MIASPTVHGERVLRSLIVAITLLVSATAWAGTDVVVVLGAERLADRTIHELLSAEERLADRGVRIAVVHGGPGEIVEDLAFGGGSLKDALLAAEARADALRRRGELTRASLTADLIDSTLDAVEWAPGAERRLLLVAGRFGLSGGSRRTIEEVVYRAERERVVVHALQTINTITIGRGWHLDPVDGIQRDVEQFLATPHATLGRVPSRIRHATLQSGGAFHVVVTTHFHPLRPYGAHPPRREEAKVALDRLMSKTSFDAYFGPRDERGVDALVELASGRRRSFEYRPDELPASQSGVDMEPLLDAVWDYVDARAALVALRDDLKHIAEPSKSDARDVGKDVAEALLRTRRLPPSRR